MHGFIFIEIKKYAETHIGSGAWRQVLETAGLGSREYINGVDYPDTEVVRIVTAASQATGTPVADLLESFGCFLAGDLFRAFRPLIDPHWRTLDFLENVEATIHRVVRARNAKARPPALVCNRVTETEVLVEYQSPRKMCPLAKGIVQGVAEHYGDQIRLTEETCMHRGDPNCRIWVATVKDVPAGDDRTRRSSTGTATGRRLYVPPRMG